MKDKLIHIAAELKGHAPFTFIGAAIGILFMLIFRNISDAHAGVMFKIFHPSHVVLSAMVTASMFELHRKAKNFLLILVIGYIGSIGIATLSDSVIPYIGETIFGLDIPSHGELHHDHENCQEHDHTATEHEQHTSVHLGFIEDWYIVNPAAVLGVVIAFFLPRTKFPHAGHVLISTWASLAHILMNMNAGMTPETIAEIFVILFIAVWVPCCVSDIVFPLLFVKSDIKLISVCECSEHSHHSHPHQHEHTEKCPEGTKDETNDQE